jgi:hypothetical protein
MEKNVWWPELDLRIFSGKESVTRKMAAGGGLAIPLLSAELANTG